MVPPDPKDVVRGPLEGEDIETEHWEDARHWMSIYDDLIRFKLGLLERVQRELPKLHPVARDAADVDVLFIEKQMAGYYDRLDLWYQRVWKLQGLWLDPTGRVLRHKGKEAVLTSAQVTLKEARRHQEATDKLFPVRIDAVPEPWEGITSLLVPQALTLGMVERTGCRLPPRFQYGVMEQ